MLFEDHSVFDQNIERRLAIASSFSVPILPKLGILLNLSAALIISIAIILLGISNKLSGNALIYDISYLIPLFCVGFTCGVLSVIFGFCSVYALEFSSRNLARFKILYRCMTSEKFWFNAAVSMMIISNLIFIISIIYGLYIVTQSIYK